jgi:hypothetical protein
MGVCHGVRNHSGGAFPQVVEGHVPRNEIVVNHNVNTAPPTV